MQHVYQHPVCHATRISTPRLSCNTYINTLPVISSHIKSFVPNSPIYWHLSPSNQNTPPPLRPPTKALRLFLRFFFLCLYIVRSVPYGFPVHARDLWPLVMSDLSSLQWVATFWLGTTSRLGIGEARFMRSWLDLYSWFERSTEIQLLWYNMHGTTMWYSYTMQIYGTVICFSYIVQLYNYVVGL